MSNITIEKKNEVYLRVGCEPHVGMELADEFTFEVPEAKFMSDYRKRYWDGKIKLFSPGTGEIYAGLLPYVTSFYKNGGTDMFTWTTKSTDYHRKWMTLLRLKGLGNS